ncbi:Ectonucleotide pyrophosphatase/phosphodiesterase family member 3 [Hypsibius exemplaris]|uniref:Ectonucleotide pyrophosphatase/phosphodiesterase family member 3 n=1 Tax=Hypsibius exemplaris TaxID=2072580 RepID=A0A1W0WSL0_HYPEX|nr:Ectonucleotide pyrophosphatase/phosphodiesterase family member 3 [Hypsibius exemplaris]
MLQLSAKGHALLCGLIVTGVLLCGGLFAIGYLLYNEPYASLDVEAEYLKTGRKDTADEQSSWFHSSCSDIVESECTLRAPGDILPVVIISLDGFAANYMNLNTTPVLHKLMTCGSHAKSLRPSFPTITFPNHYSIATGLHLESHGIVDNKFFDPVLRRSFHYKDGDAGPNADPVWWKGEPLWVTAKKQGKKVNTYYWPGNEVLIRGFRADEWFHYDHNDTFDNRLDRIINRLSRPLTSRPDLIMMYYDEPDKGGHIYGINAPQVTEAIKQVDASLGRFMQGLYDRNLTQCVNLIVLSDHGMENAYCNTSVDIMAMLNHTERSGQKRGSENFITDEDFILRGHTEGGIDSRSSNVTLDTLYSALSCKAALLPNSSISALPFLLYQKKDLPRRFHYTNSPRIEPLILNVKPGFTVFQTAHPDNFCFGGRHGYDPYLQSMDSIFITHGPAFKQGVQVEPITNTELYDFFCELVGVKAAPNNGTPGALHDVLRNPLKRLSQPLGAVVVWPPDLPKTSLAVIQRQNQYCLQACSEVTGRVVGADMLLMLSDQEQKQLLDKHTSPYGPPEAASNKTEILTLVNKIVPTYLVPPEFGTTRTRKTEGTLITNVVPMYLEFRRGVWKSFWKMVGRWSNSTATGTVRRLHVYMGLVFDHNLPYGLPDDDYRMVPHLLHDDVPLPSHYFVIVSRTSKMDDRSSHRFSASHDTVAFILPHQIRKTHDCQNDEEYFLDHSATVKDVEIITGLRFFTETPIYDSIRLRLRQHTKLWL